MAEDPIDADLLYQQGVAAIKAGDLAAGRQRLIRLLKSQPNHADAWVWLSVAIKTDKEAAFCVKKALDINPDHEAARERLAQLTGASPPPAAPAPPPEPAEPEPEPELEPDPEPAAGPDESWRQAFAEGTWQPGEEDDETAEIDADWHEPAVESEPEKAEEQPPAGRTWQPATPGDEAWMGTGSAAQKSKPGTAEPAEGESDEGRESWRAALYEAESEEEEAESKKKKRRKRPNRTALEIMEQKAARPADYGILDLFDAWAQALYFKVVGAYEDTVHYGGFGYTVLTLVVAGVLAAVSSVLLFQLVLAPMGGVQALVAEVGMLEDATPEAITFLTRFFSNLGLGIAAFAFMQVVFGRLFYGVLIHVVAGLFGGKGSISETLSALSLATMARTIIMLIPVLILVLALLLSLPTGLVTGVGGLFYFVWFAYVWVVEVTAIQTAHPQLSVLAAIGTVVALGILLSLFVCCLSFGAGALGASGAS